jgi:YD repeat-containing protein
MGDAMVAIFTGAGTGFERGSGAVLGGMGLLGQSSLGRNGEQVMLNAANGNLLITQRDEFLVGRGPDAAISRTYNSQGAFTDDNRDNWRQGTDRRLTWHTGSWMANGSAVKQHMGDGSEKLFWWDGSHYVSTEGGGAHEKLVHLGSGWNLVDGNGQVTETYQDYYGETPGGYSRLIEQTDSSGNKLTYSYAGHNVSRVTTADGGYVDYHWSGNNITQITAGGHGTARTRTRYGYDHLSRLTSVTVDLSPNDHHQGGDGYTTTYGYHGDSRLVAFIAQTDGSRMDFGYDGAGRVNSITQKIADGVGRTTTIAYGHLHTHVTDATGQLTALEYNADGSLRTVIAPPAHWGAPQQVVRFGYNGNGDLTSVTDAAGGVTSYTHDARGNVVGETDRLGNLITRTFGARNELLTETRVGSDQSAGAVHQTTRYVYDGANRLGWIVTAEGRVMHMTYDHLGLHRNTYEVAGYFYNTRALSPTAAISEAQLVHWWHHEIGDKSEHNVEYLDYDARGNLTQRVLYGGANGGGGGDFDDGYQHIYYSYDQAGQLLRKEVASLGAEHFSYDGLGRLIRSTDLNGGATSIAFNDGATQTVVTLANGFVQTSSYNKAGDLVAHTDGGDFVAGGTTNHRYDRLGRLRMTTDATGRNSFFIYDKVGRKVADITHDGHITEYRYDANDRVVASVRYTVRGCARCRVPIGASGVIRRGCQNQSSQPN